MDYRLGLHLMPPTGWMNDPNGLCQYNGEYHVFFQYAPSGPNGWERFWGHYVSEDMVNWHFVGIPVVEGPLSENGAYSGSAFTGDGSLEIFYTGNVEQEGDYDYTYSGRISNQIREVSEDGRNFADKKLLLSPADYPDGFTCHIRDPKVWQKDGTCHMVLGGRKMLSGIPNENTDYGALLFYTSPDRIHWHLRSELTGASRFGYMWECPDAFMLGDKCVVTFCPQGTPRGTLSFQNKYHSGYILMDGIAPEELSGLCDTDKFTEWDMGFDFYAPQSFVDNKGRRILYGWAGVPGMEEEYNNAPTIAEGWQHSLTLPRVLTVKDDKILQWPAKEIDSLRGKLIADNTEPTLSPTKLRTNCQLLDITGTVSKAGEIEIDDIVRFTWRNKDGSCSLVLMQDPAHSGGRTVRRAEIPALTSFRIIKDTSMLEIYCNEGECVFTTRYFPKKTTTKISAQGCVVKVWKLNPIQVEFEG